MFAQPFSLLGQLVQRDLANRFKGSLMGPAWMVLSPLLSLVVYTIAFRDILHVKMGVDGQGSAADFALSLFAGLVVFRFFVGVISRSPRLLLEQPQLITRVVFPLELLSVSLVLAEWLLACVGLVLLGATLALTGHTLSWGLLLTPLVLASLLPVLLGLAWTLSGLGVYLRDIQQMIDPALGLLIFLTPVFYPSSAVPSALTHWLWLNPMLVPIDSLRELFFSTALDTFFSTMSQPLGVLIIVGSLFAAMTLRFFNIIKTGFADVV